MKLKLIPLFVILILVFSQCDDSLNKTGYLELRGYTQGTTYQIVYKDSTDQQQNVEKILTHVDKLFNLWDSTSVISQLNEYSSLERVFMFPDTSLDFTIMMEISRDIHKKTDGAFDPSLLPLMELWKFGKDETVLPSQQEIDSVKQYTGFTEFDFMIIDNPYEVSDTTQIRKTHPERKLDFNAIAQGYTADLIGNMFLGQGIENFMVNIGGEIKVNGKNPSSKNWSIGIQNPSVEDEEAKSIVKLTDCGVATSGNYRNFKQIGDSRYSHTIDGRTGQPVTHGLLSCTVIASTAYEADAYATAFMVMGTAAVDEFLRSNHELGLQVYLIEDLYGEYHVTYTEGFPLAEESE